MGRMLLNRGRPCVQVGRMPGQQQQQCKDVKLQQQLRAATVQPAPAERMHPASIFQLNSTQTCFNLSTQRCFNLPTQSCFNLPIQLKVHFVETKWSWQWQFRVGHRKSADDTKQTFLDFGHLNRVAVHILLSFHFQREGGREWTNK